MAPVGRQSASRSLRGPGVDQAPGEATRCRGQYFAFFQSHPNAGRRTQHVALLIGSGCRSLPSRRVLRWLHSLALPLDENNQFLFVSYQSGGFAFYS